MKNCIIIGLFAVVSLTTTNCNKKDNSPTKTKSDLPQNAQTFLQNCDEGCKSYIQLVTLGGQTYFYMGYNTVFCDPNPNRVQYLEITGEPVLVTSDLHAQLIQNGVLVDEIYNCDDQ